MLQEVMEEESPATVNIKNEISVNSLKDVLLSWIEEELKKKGYTVVRDYVVESSGVKHRFDLLAEQEAIPGLKISIGVIFVNSNQRIIDVDVVERYIAWRETLPIDSIVLVTTKNVSPEARELASRYGIDLIVISEDTISKLVMERKGLAKMLEGYYYIKPRIDADYVIKYVEASHKSIFFKKPKVKISNIALVYIPLVVGNIEMSRAGVVAEEIEIVKGKVVVDGIHGYVVTRHNNALAIYEDIGSLVEDISDKAIEALDIVSNEITINISSLGSKLDISDEDLKQILDTLSSKTLVDVYGDIVEFKGLDPHIFTDIDSIVTEYRCEVVKGTPPAEIPGIVKLGINISIPKFEKLLRSLRCELHNLYVIYYPFYIVFLSEVKNGEEHEKLIIIDAITGEEAGDISKVFLDIDTIEYIRRHSLDIQRLNQMKI
ncbi:hypothetical protein Igag_0325 [Ignisphaera aggregans DSM 17230]|uniref:Restriction endonuclease type IV Mrr domain-containing protein n=1 Tax=Ignisphaera aggregans (strain DSM 17230 / JCM 13409 / AQ1.S1) TaxID=583356 RepID=E0SR22_IGNAA|nr:hypothetical protein Igag_0325 [Ignisphaera aggregans DSM 17230]